MSVSLSALVRRRYHEVQACRKLPYLIFKKHTKHRKTSNRLGSTKSSSEATRQENKQKGGKKKSSIEAAIQVDKQYLGLKTSSS